MLSSLPDESLFLHFIAVFAVKELFLILDPLLCKINVAIRKSHYFEVTGLYHWNSMNMTSYFFNMGRTGLYLVI